MHQTPTKIKSPEAELTEFAATLFKPTDQIEIRAIETWTGEGKSSKLHARLWVKASELRAHYDSLKVMNERGANIFFGVNPRNSNRGTKASVGECRTLWCDWDNMSPKEAIRRCKESHSEPPSVLVRSGHGVHGYWVLKEAFPVSDFETHTRFECRLRSLCHLLGGDATQDVTRLLRLPGFLNVKDFRNGAPVTSCEVVYSDKSARYKLSVTERWDLQRETLPSIPRVFIKRNRREERIQGFLRYLDRDVMDRSRRDFGVVLGLLRLGTSPDEIRKLVQGKSKFADDEGGEEYLNRTLTRAVSIVSQNK